jgi:hypothetical protein
MSQRAEQLHATAEGQIDELIALMSTLDEAALRRPCPGRQKLGDGTVGAAARHTADNYRRIAAFVRGGEAGTGRHGNGYTADSIDLGAVTGLLSAARTALARIAQLSDSQLDAVPAKDSFRFCDGQRSLEVVLAGLLTHQGHQVGALRTAAS